MLRNWECLSNDELFDLHQQVQSVLRERLIARRQLLDNQSRQLNQLFDARSKES